MAANNPMVPPMDPRAMAAMGMPNPFAPPDPPPPSPSLGFQVWASDPRNAHKVQPAMTAPDAPLQPNHPQMASANPPQPAPMASAAPPANVTAPVNLPQAPAPSMPSAQPAVRSQADVDRAKLNQYQTEGAGLNKIHNGFLRGLAKVGDVAESIVAPGIAALTPGTTNHNLLLQQQQQGRVANDQAALQANAQLADTQSQTAQRNALGEKAGAQADAYQPVTLTQEQANAIGQPNLAGETLSSRAYTSMITGKQKNDSNERVQTGKNQTTETVASGKNDTAKQIATERNERIKTLADAANKTKLLLQDKRDATSQANTGDRLAAKPAAGTTGGKVPMDVTKRAALASNVNENADAVEGLIAKRPDLLGAAGGRFTSVQQMVGSDDPDIQELGVRMHNIALASNGAHGLRSAEAVAQTEKELFNNFKTGAQGVQGALRGTRQSVQTFLDDEKSFQQTGRRTGGNPMQPPTKGGALAPTHVYNQSTGQIEAVR